MESWETIPTFKVSLIPLTHLISVWGGICSSHFTAAETKAEASTKWGLLTEPMGSALQAEGVEVAGHSEGSLSV